MRTKMETWKDNSKVDQEAFDYVGQMGDDLENIRSIYALALPSDQLMFNIIRACIGIDNTEDLWFYHKRLLYND